MLWLARSYWDTVIHMASSFERREHAEPLPRCEGLASEGTGRYFLLARRPSGEPMRVQLHQVSAPELLRHFVVAGAD